MSDFERSSRKDGWPCIGAGFVAMSLAFNTESKPEWRWRFSADVRDRVNELCAELEELFVTGDIEVNPAHAAYALAQDARNNPALQSLIRRASKRTPIRAKKA